MQAIARKRLVSLSAVVLVVAAFSAAYAAEYWVAPMTAVHANFQGNRGTIARFGDSITYSGAFFKPLRGDFTNATTADQAALDWIKSYVKVSCWSWQDDAVAYSDGNFSGTKSTWPLQVEQAPPARNIDAWLNKLKPELAVIMWGTNDVSDSSITVASYKSNMRQVVQACKAFGTIPILTTIPPRVGAEAQTVGAYPNSGGTGLRGTFVQAIIELASEEQVPLVDYNKAILDRRPNNWNSTLIDPADGVHPSNPGGQYDLQNLSAATLNFNGYALRNYVTLYGLYAVRQNILVNDPAFQNAKIEVFDTASSDVPGPQPIRVFPIPAAAGWTGGELIYDNWAAGLQFNTAIAPPYSSIIDPPFGNSKVTIHVVKNTPADPMVLSDAETLYVTAEGSATDARANNRFPYRVPRLARDPMETYLAVEFDLTPPVEKFGMFLPASSNNCVGGSTDDQNFLLQDRSVYVTIFNDAGEVETSYTPLTVGDVGTYCPFLSLTWDLVHKISKVSVIHDVAENTNRGVSFMDVYTYTGVQPLIGDINNDGYVNVGDLEALVAAWASQKTPPSSNWSAAADINGDDYVNVGDLQLLVAHWGEHR